MAMKVLIENLSLSQGEPLVMQVEGLLCDGLANLDVYIGRVDDDRDIFCLAWGVPAEEIAPSTRIERPLADLEPGLYALSGLQQSRSTSDGLEIVGRWTSAEFGRQVFEIREPHTPVQSSEEVAAVDDVVLRRRDEAFLSGFGLPAETPDTEGYQVLVFLRHGLLSSRARLGQYEVIPAESVGVEGELRSVVRFLNLLGAPPLAPDVLTGALKEGETEQPCYVVHFPKVIAHSASEARALAESEVRNLAGIVALYRGAYPSVYAQVVRNLSSGEARVWTLDWSYRGNRVGGALGGERPRAFVQAAGKARGDARLGLYLDMFCAASAETSREGRYFRYWNLLETMAGRVVVEKSDPRVDWYGAPVLSTKKKTPLLVEGPDQLVFEYLRRTLPGLPIGFPFHEAKRDGSLADDVAIWYRHRNCLVHRGGCFSADSQYCDQSDPRFVRCRSARDAMVARDGDPELFRDDELELLAGTARACVAGELL